MKVRTDFVTNSSSSSFIISYTAMSPNKAMGFDAESFKGDLESTVLTYAENKGGKVIRKYACDPFTRFLEAGLSEDPEDVPEYLFDRCGFSLEVGPVNLSDFADSDAAGFAKRMSDAMGTYDEDNEDDEELDEDVSEEELAIILQIKEDLKNAKAEFKKSLQEEKDSIQQIRVSMNFSGWGEMTPFIEDILRAVFGNDAVDIYDICQTESEDEAVETLKRKDYFNNVELESIRKLVQLVQSRDDFYDELTFEQTLGKDGIVKYEFCEE